MAEFRLSLRAKADLLAVYDYTEAKFGSYQADAYHAGLEHSFGLLANFPLIGTSAGELAPGYRRFRFQSHYIFYTDGTDHVFIRGGHSRTNESAPSTVRPIEQGVQAAILETIP